MPGRSSMSPYWGLAASGAALIAALGRWLVQGTENVYTAADKRFYVPDPDFGWRIHESGPLWLGLDAIGALAALTVALGTGAWLLRRRERTRGTPWRGARVALLALGIAPLALPLWAFASGLAPEGGREQPPQSELGPRPDGIGGALAGSTAGRYVLVPGAESAVTARVTAGGETFETRFAGNLEASLTFDPGDLRAPVEAAVRVDAASVDTGVTMRSKHAREEYLYADEHPEIRLAMVELVAARQGEDAREIAFWASAALDFMGARLTVPVTGTIRALDEAARARLGTSGPALLVTADLAIDIEETPLGKDAGDFDEDRIPIHVSLVLGQASANGAPAETPSTP